MAAPVNTCEFELSCRGTSSSRSGWKLWFADPVPLRRELSGLAGRGGGGLPVLAKLRIVARGYVAKLRGEPMEINHKLGAP